MWRGCFDWIKVIDVAGCGSVGDVMRTLDSRAELQGDWLLLHAGLICTDTLAMAVQQYKLVYHHDQGLLKKECGIFLGKKIIKRLEKFGKNFFSPSYDPSLGFFSFTTDYRT